MAPAEVTARVRLGRSRLEVPRLGIGTVPIGEMLGPVDQAEAVRVMRRAHEMGAALFDTAPQYGHGVAERRLGMVLPELPRDEFIVITKVGRLLRPVSSVAKLRGALADAARFGPRRGALRMGRNTVRAVKRISRRPTTARLGYPLERGDAAIDIVNDYTYDGAMRSIEESLERLRLERIDVALIHDPDDHQDAALTGAYRALSRMRDEGVVSAIGVGTNGVDVLLRFAREGEFDCFLIAGRYTMLDQSALPHLLPLCAERAISVVIGGVYNSGLLADPRPGQLFDYQRQRRGSRWLERALQMQEICARFDVPLAAAAIQFPLGHPAVATVLTGVRSVAELEVNARMLAWPIPTAMWEELVTRGFIFPQAPFPAQVGAHGPG